MYSIDEIGKFKESDTEKLALIEGLLDERVNHSRIHELHSPVLKKIEFAEKLESLTTCDMAVSSKFCPKCGRSFDEDENFCPDCLVTLKRVSDKPDIKSLDASPDLTFPGKNDYANILNPECFRQIEEFDFSMDDFKSVLFSIKSQAFKNMDGLIKDNSIDLEDLEILDRVMLFAKSFVRVEYKSYGQTLGYFELNKIFIDDRQRDSLQITTLIHELTHFLIKEILVGVICKILDCSKNRHIESVVTYILNYSQVNGLIDEYAAHSVEGRFTVFGYQDYSSFLALQKDMDAEHVDIAKTIGNTFSIYIKDMLEGFLDSDARHEIKTQFLKDTIEQPNYEQLRHENCNKLSDEGFIKAIWLILSEIENADANKIRDIEMEFQSKSIL
ncbi:zinc ribbon domain-containing protein [Methanobrevibacter sp.]|uniref:zinc ribbon domain-containing protein n=1 Tax=Methanobrevibacter sp. TaxID=66852 RepID=UPI0025FFD122|nr:zinc ribbon domain-containing protein [Methanobrevibacter sp.]MBQ6512545.1 zinc ribbon domain-containing protein [Methanobrevibacter sp.]